MARLYTCIHVHVALLSLVSDAKELSSTLEEAWGMCRKQHACWLTPTCTEIANTCMASRDTCTCMSGLHLCNVIVRGVHVVC